MKETKFKRIQCIDRTLDILGAVAGGEFRTIAEICDAVGLLPATGYNIVKTLMARNAISMHGGCYRIGPAIGLLGSKWDVASDFPSLMRPLLECFYQETGHASISVSCLNGSSLELYTFVANSPRGEYRKRIFDEPMEVATGRVIIAHQNKSEWMEWIERYIASGKRAPHENAFDHYQYYKQLETIAQTHELVIPFHGAVGEFVSIALPVFASGGAVIGAVGISLLGACDSGKIHSMRDILKKLLEETNYDNASRSV